MHDLGWFSVSLVSMLVAAQPARAADAGLSSHRLTPVADTSLYSDITGSSSSWDDVSDGQGESLWLSTTAGGLLRRALLRFDLSQIPAGQRVVRSKR